MLIEIPEWVGDIAFGLALAIGWFVLTVFIVF